MISKRFHLHWMFECPEAVMTCSVLKCAGEELVAFGGHDKTLYLMNKDLQIIDDVAFDGWCRCSYPIDFDGDGCEDILVGTGDDRLLVLKFDEKKQKLVAVMNYKSEGKINCCIAGDFYRDGDIEIIFGGEPKQLLILKDLNSKEPVETLYYDSWVTSCALGFLKLPKVTTPTFSLLVGTKNGLLQMIQLKDSKPDIVWQRNTYGQINDIKIGDVTNDGFNEIIIASGDSYLKIYNSLGERLRYIHIEKEESKSKSKKKEHLNRPISLLIQDIDGDNANEIITGCADGTLRVFHNIDLNSTNFELKWKTKTSSSIKDICSLVDKDQNLTHIIFGGYERTLRNVTDFEWGKKPVLKIPQRFKIPKIPPKKDVLDVKEGEKFEVIPTNLRGFIIKLLEKRGFYLTTEMLINELLEKGYNRDQIKEELELMKSQETVSYGKIDLQVWSIPDDIIEDLILSLKRDAEKPKLVEKADFVQIPGAILDQLKEHEKQVKKKATKKATKKAPKKAPKKKPAKKK